MESQLLTGPSGSLADRLKPARRVFAGLPSLSVRQRWLIAIYVLGIFPGLWIVFMTQGSFNTPDEFSRHFAASTFAEHLKFTFSDEVTAAAEAGSVAPRGYTLADGAAVPNHSLGFLLALGIVHLFLPDVLAPTVLVLIAGLIFPVWASVINRLVNRSWLFTGLLLVGVAPLWYWTARPYLDTAVVILLLGVSVLWMIDAYQSKSPLAFKLAILPLSLASLLRTPDAVFLGIVIVGFTAVFIRHTRSFRWKDSRDLYLWVAGSQVFVFILPTLFLNWVTNGSPFALGYTIFLSQEFPAEHEVSSNLIVLVFNSFREAVFPDSFDIGVLRNGIIYQMVFMNPALFVLGITGLWTYRERLRAVLGRPGLAVGGFAILYLLVSRATSETFGALQTTPDLNISMVRYWLPIYLVLAVGVAFSLRMVPMQLRLPIVGLIVAQSIFMVFYTGTTPLPKLVDSIRNESKLYATALNEVVEEDAVIVVTSPQDKWTALERRTIGIWQPADESLTNVSNTIIQLVERDTRVYLLDDRPVNTDFITTYVEPHGIETIPVLSQETGISFVRFTLAPQVMELMDGEDGAYSAVIDTPVRQFGLFVESDGSSTNYVLNPSFEDSINSWAARGEGEITVSDEFAAFGDHSLRMEFTDSENVGDAFSARVNFVTEDIPDGSWFVRARVRPEILDNSIVGMRIHVRDKDGNLLDRGYEEVTVASDSFVVMDTPVKDLPEGAASILIQLAVTPQAEGATARVFWDGIELMPNESLTYCDGDNNRCEWQGAPHQSTSSRVSVLRSIEVTSGNQATTVVGVISSGSSLQFRDDSVYLAGPDGNEISEPKPFAWSVDDPVTVQFESIATPLIILSTGDE